MDADQTSKVCPRCAAPLPPDAPQGFCPACLLERAAFEKPDDPGNLFSDPIETTGTRIGRYKLIEQIGEGGFGVVYMAEQIEPVKRLVALKIIKAGMDTKEVIARFEAERQALALMDHPNIAQVYDGGATQAGRPYFVMELVRGIPITKFCDQRSLDTKARLQLFMQVCKAVQHAHQKGIIHRDLKPSNILVTHHESEPMPKIIDFGVAKALGQKLTDKTLFTGFLRMVGTPAYMSPEQAEFTGMDVDTRSDVYSLGVLLYELLTGVTPFDPETIRNAALDEVRRMIRETEPPKPSTRLDTLGEKLDEIARQRHTEATKLVHALAGDLDWIVMKCLEKDRRRRYETVNGLAMDVQRHLDDEPVVARPPSKLYEFQKTVRRHKFGFAAAGGITMALAVGLLISLTSLSREKVARERAVAAEEEQTKQREKAEANEQMALTEAAKSAEVAQFMKEMLQAAGPSVARGRDATLLREVLAQTSARVGEDLAGEPEVQGDLLFTIGKAYADIGEYKQAIEELQRASEAYRLAQGDQKKNLALALGAIGRNQAWIGQVSLGQSNATAALELAKKTGDRQTIATCLYSLAIAIGGVGGVIEEEPYLREAVSIYESLGADPRSLAACLSRLGNCLMEGSSRLRESEQLYHEALRLHLKHEGDESLSVATDFYMLAQVFLRQGELDKAEKNATESVERLRKLVDKDHPRLLFPIELLSHTLILGNKWNEAEVLCRQAVESSPANAGYRTILGGVYARRSDWTAAADELSVAVSIDPSKVFDSFKLAIALLKADRTNEYLEHCHNLLSRFGDTPDFGAADKVAKVSLLLPVKGGDFDRACQLADFAASATTSKWLVQWVSLGKALAEYRRDRHESAIGLIDRILPTSDQTPSFYSTAFFIEAASFAKLQQFESAKTAFEKGDLIATEGKGKPTGNFAGSWHNWAITDILREQAQELIDQQTAAFSKEER